jgi:transcriptional regulator with XRE-family HTH domain
MDRTELQVALGKTIRDLRSARGYSQESFADAVGLHRTYMGGIERGERNVGVVNLSRIAEALELPLSGLIAEAEKAMPGHPRQVGA